MMTDAQDKKIPLRNDFIGWDTHNWSKALNHFEKHLPKRKLKCLELGANLGGLSLWLASKGHDVICSDTRDRKKEAQEFHLRYAYDGKISYEVIDASSIPYKDEFDIIILKSVLGGVGREGNKENVTKAADEIHKALKKDGLFLFAENLSGSFLHRFFRKRFISWSNNWSYFSKSEFNQYLHKFSHYELKTAGFAGAFGVNEKMRRSLGKMDSVLFDNITPSKSHYIIYGHAKK